MPTYLRITDFLFGIFIIFSMKRLTMDTERMISLMNKNKLLLSTVIAGLGVGATTVLRTHKNQLKDIATSHKNKIENQIHSFDIYNQLDNAQRGTVAKNFLRIIPKNDLHKSLNYQIDINNYIKILKYLAHRNEFHTHDASCVLHLPYRIVKRIKPTLIKQHLIRPQARFVDGVNISTSYVLHPNIHHTLSYLSHYKERGQLVKPLVFNIILNNSIASNIFK